METAQQVLTELQAHIEEVQNSAETCLRESGSTLTSLKAELKLSGDEDIGVLIDASSVVTADGAPVPAQLDDCIRTQLQSLVLPPIKNGDGFLVNYEFDF